jgi:hypothetical protein
MSKTFDVAGVSTKHNVVKFRVANGKPEARAKVLEKDGHTNIDLFQLPKPMTKEQVFALLVSKGYKESKEVTAKPAKAVNAPKFKIVKTKAKKLAKLVVTKEVPAVKIIEEVGLVVGTGAPTTKSIAEVGHIKSKNLETMRQVSNRLKAIRNFN